MSHYKNDDDKTIFDTHNNNHVYVHNANLGPSETCINWWWCATIWAKRPRRTRTGSWKRSKSSLSISPRSRTRFTARASHTTRHRVQLSKFTILIIHIYTLTLSFFVLWNILFECACITCTIADQINYLLFLWWKEKVFCYNFYSIINFVWRMQELNIKWGDSWVKKDDDNSYPDIKKMFAFVFVSSFCFCKVV